MITWIRKRWAKTKEPSPQRPLVIEPRKSLYDPTDIVVEGEYSEEDYRAACNMLDELELTWGKIYSISSWGDVPHNPYGLTVTFRKEQAKAAMLFKLTWGGI